MAKISEKVAMTVVVLLELLAALGLVVGAIGLFHLAFGWPS